MTRGDLAETGVALVQRDPSGVDDGAVEPLADAAVAVTDRGFLYGDAVFETLRCYDGAPAFPERHGDRLAEALDRLALPFAPPGGAGSWLAELADRLVAALDDRGALGADPRDAYVRVSVTRGAQHGLLEPTETVPTVVAVARPLATRRYEPAVVATTDVPRPNVAADLKTHNYLSSILARADAGGDVDADEALLLAPDGDRYVSGAASNLVARVDGDWVAPRTGARPGVTREVALELLDDRDVAVAERPLGGDAIEAAFLTNSTWGVRPVARIDGRALDDADLVTAVRDAYRRRAAGER